ncbi:hypothetical protein D9C73_021115 [Collichthys lucidus]|uniref:Uncharacterized protein n=1 Tax=Collichthys lucidus TaxID=240159 RepID=A0A4V6AS53_COLLU|nr:hypothetical protein D9C73_021115 [Collichthys lucidus]
MVVDLTSGGLALAINYIFTALNAFQGFFILLTTCLFDKMVRQLYIAMEISNVNHNVLFIRFRSQSRTAFESPFCNHISQTNYGGLNRPEFKASTFRAM